MQETVPARRDATPRPTARAAMPAEVAATYTEVPTALMEHGDALGLTCHERALAVALCVGYFPHGLLGVQAGGLRE